EGDRRFRCRTVIAHVSLTSGFGGTAEINRLSARAASAAFDPIAVIGQIEIPQRSSLLPHRAVLSFSRKHGRRSRSNVARSSRCLAAPSGGRSRRARSQVKA